MHDRASGRGFRCVQSLQKTAGNGMMSERILQKSCWRRLLRQKYGAALRKTKRYLSAAVIISGKYMEKEKKENEKH